MRHGATRSSTRKCHRGAISVLISAKAQPCICSLIANPTGLSAEYTAKYNVNETVPYEPYESWEGVLEEISPDSRSDLRPGFELLYAHYAEIKGLDASWSKAFRDYVNENTDDNVEGGGGDYSPNSGGFDCLGHGTLLYRL